MHPCQLTISSRHFWLGATANPPKSEWKKWATGQSCIRKRSTTCKIGTLAGSSKTAPKIFIFSIVLGAEYLSYVKSNIGEIHRYLCPYIFCLLFQS